MIALKRPMYCPSDKRGPTVGKDVQIAKNGIGRYETNILPKPSAGYSETFGHAMEEAVRQIQKAERIRVTGNIGAETWEVIWQYLSPYQRWRYERFTPPPKLSPQDLAFARLLDSMIQMDNDTPGYLLGGGHGVPLSQLRTDIRLDCSSSISKALFAAGMFPDTYAWVSGEFGKWGYAGPGTYFTVYYNSEHVWTRLHRSRWWRFDTSPHGDGGRGPHLRYLPRSTSGFTTRHWAGM